MHSPRSGGGRSKAGTDQSREARSQLHDGHAVVEAGNYRKFFCFAILFFIGTEKYVQAANRSHFQKRHFTQQHACLGAEPFRFQVLAGKGFQFTIPVERLQCFVFSKSFYLFILGK